MTLVVKTAGDPLALVGAVRNEVRALDGSLPIAAIRPMQDVVDTSIATPRLTGWLLGTFAALGARARGRRRLRRAVLRRQPPSAGDWRPDGDGRGPRPACSV